MDTNSLIDYIRQIIIDNTSFEKVFSPAIPQNEENVCCITLLGGNTVNNLCGDMIYSNISLRVLIRGNENDSDTCSLVDEVFNALHLLRDSGNVINCIASNTPIFIGKDENQRILYNITFNLTVK